MIYTGKSKAWRKKYMTCIQLTKLTRDKLATFGVKDDTFEDIIIRLLQKKKKLSL